MLCISLSIIAFNKAGKSVSSETVKSENDISNNSDNIDTQNSNIYNSDDTQDEEVIRDCYENRVALTFDDGPGGKTTEKLLDGLKERDVKATFFLIG